MLYKVDLSYLYGHSSLPSSSISIVDAFHEAIPMPNISFDVFYDQDFVNFTVSRGGAAPKAKPAWKIRSAPKLPPKEIPAPTKPNARPAPREKLTASRQPQGKQRKPSVTDTSSQVGDAPKKKPPKLGPRKTSSQA